MCGFYQMCYGLLLKLLFHSLTVIILSPASPAPWHTWQNYTYMSVTRRLVSANTQNVYSGKNSEVYGMVLKNINIWPCSLQTVVSKARRSQPLYQKKFLLN